MVHRNIHRQDSQAHESNNVFVKKDETGRQDISGAFYNEQLQKVKFPDVYLLEKVLKRKGNKVFVKWLGLDVNHNSWIASDNIA